MNKKTVLMIAYYFPPVGGGGVQRSAKFAKYLPKFGWQPVVLTVKTDVFRRTKRAIDTTLGTDIPAGIHVERTRGVDLANVSRSIRSHKGSTRAGWIKALLNRSGQLLINPDAQMLWIPGAVYAGLKLIKRCKIDLIYSTGNPWSDHIAGLILKHITGLPWVADYRDPWNLNPFYDYSSRFRRKIHWFLESRVMGNISAAVFTTDIMKEDYQQAFGKRNFVTIRNGFDRDDIEKAKCKKFDKFTIVYSGNMQPYRGPFYFLKGLSNWLSNNREARSDVQLVVLGTINAEVQELAERMGLSSFITLTGYVSHNETIEYIKGAHALLSIVEFGGESIIPGKIYEYLASGKPILALAPPSGSVQKLLNGLKRSEFTVSPRDPLGVEKKLAILYERYKSGKNADYGTANLAAFSRERTCEELSALFNSLLFHGRK